MTPTYTSVGAVVCGGGGAEGHVLLRAPELDRSPELRLPEHRQSSRSSAIISTVPTTNAMLTRSQRHYFSYRTIIPRGDVRIGDKHP